MPPCPPSLSLSPMAEPLMKTHHTNPRSNSFLCCFGFSGKKKPPEKTIRTSSIRKSSSLLSWPMFRLRVRKSRTKTVPVDNNEKAEDDCKSHTPKLIKQRSDSKLSSKPQSPTNHKPSRQNSKVDQPLPSSNQAARERPKETRLKGPDQKIILGNTKLLEPTRSGSSLPGSPNIKHKPQPKTHSKLSHTVSLPVIQGKQRVGNPRIHGQTNLKELQRKNKEVVEKMDTVMGMSILMVTLIMMLLWGRLCAILCTSAWFYFCRRFRATNYNNETTTNSKDLDLNSEEYKKKVVLEGLLQRNRRITL
ncbi:hypothetical protein DITRI_Ditri08aG0073100 [Diplodiscus trichospermus]